MEHSKLSASKRVRWSNCPGSIREEAKYPQSESNPSAIDGTHSHELLKHCINQGLMDAKKMIGVDLTSDEGTFKVDLDRAIRVNLAVNYIREKSKNGKYKVIAEERVDPKHLLGRDDLYGTADCQIIGDDFIEIVDYKDGVGNAQVSGFLQLEQYGYGALAAYGLPVNVEYPVKRLIMTIIQPKLALFGEQGIISNEVDVPSFLAKSGEIIAQAAATDSPNAPLVPGEHQCRYCPAKGACSALAIDVLNEAGVKFPVIDLNEPEPATQLAEKDPSKLSNNQLRQLIEAAPLMRIFIDALEDELIKRMMAGEHVEGCKLVKGRGFRKWLLEEKEIENKLIKMGIPKNLLWETKFISPSAAENLSWFKKDGTPSQLTDRQIKRMQSEYIIKTDGKITWAFESDSRPAIITNAASLFSAIEIKPEPEVLISPPLPFWLL